MTVLLKRGTWWSIAPGSRRSMAGSLFIFRMKPSRLARQSRPQSTAIHFLVCLYQRLKLRSQNSCFLKTEVTLTDDHVIEKIDLQKSRADPARCRRVAGWVIVYERKGVSGMNNCRAGKSHEGPRKRFIHGPSGNIYPSNATVLCI